LRIAGALVLTADALIGLTLILVRTLRVAGTIAWLAVALIRLTLIAIRTLGVAGAVALFAIVIWPSRGVPATTIISARRALFRVSVLVAGQPLQQLLPALLQAWCLSLRCRLGHGGCGERQSEKGRCNGTHLDLPCEISGKTLLSIPAVEAATLAGLTSLGMRGSLCSGVR